MNPLSCYPKALLIRNLTLSPHTPFKLPGNLIKHESLLGTIVRNALEADHPDFAFTATKMRWGPLKRWVSEYIY